MKCQCEKRFKGIDKEKGLYCEYHNFTWFSVNRGIQWVGTLKEILLNEKL